MFEEGKRYLIVTTFGWGFVGRMVKRVGINSILLADCHFITKCGENTDWGRFARTGPGANPIVNLIGETVVNLDHHIWATEYRHDMPKSR